MREAPVKIQRWDGSAAHAADDVVAGEAPLQVRIEGQNVAVLMRTPGEDRALVAGFLLTEGIIEKAGDVFEISTCPSSASAGGNVVDVVLTRPEQFDAQKLTRHVFTSSSCGICGKASVENVIGSAPAPLGKLPELDMQLLAALPDRQRAAQAAFQATGGIHASALFDLAGNLLAIHEDVGRHNALDKLIGARLLAGQFPLKETILLLSGRVSFELMQKAYAARIPIIAAIGAPSSLAVEFAAASGQRLVGFLRQGRANIYA
jgi:FdhD protein